MKICNQCGRSAGDDEIFCQGCGMKFENAFTNGSDPQSANVNYFNNTDQANSPLFQSSDYNKIVNDVGASSAAQGKSAVGGLVCGILSSIFSALNYLGVPFVHMIGIVLGIIAISICGKQVKFKVSLAVAGLVTGIIGLILGATAFMIGFVFGLLSA